MSLEQQLVIEENFQKHLTKDLYVKVLLEDFEVYAKH
jgi:hypothetical protein